MTINLKEIFAAMNSSVFAEYIKKEIEEACISNNPHGLHSVFVCGRYGAGKSTFADNWLGHAEYFPVYYHIDSDKIMDDLYKDGLVSTRSSLSDFRAVQASFLEFAAHADLGFTYSFAGKGSIGPLEYRKAKTVPGYSELSPEEKIIPKHIGHMVLCDQDVAIRRVKNRQAKGGHPFQPLEGDFEKLYRDKQAEIIHGLPQYADKTNDYYIWDSSEDGYQKLVMHLGHDDYDNLVVTVHDKEAANKFGLTEENLSIMYELHENYSNVYEYVLGHIIQKQFSENGEKLFSQNSDALNMDLIRDICSESEDMRLFLEFAEKNAEPMTFVEGPEIKIGAMVKYQGPMKAPCSHIVP